MLNKVILMGRFTADPELRQTPNGVSVTPFRIAVDRNFNSKDGERQVDFINIVAWRQTAEFIARYFVKGQMIALEGSKRAAMRTKTETNAWLLRLWRSMCGLPGAKATMERSRVRPIRVRIRQIF